MISAGYFQREISFCHERGAGSRAANQLVQKSVRQATGCRKSVIRLAWNEEIDGSTPSSLISEGRQTEESSILSPSAHFIVYALVMGNPYLDEFEKRASQQIGAYGINRDARLSMTQKYSWAIPNAEAIARIASFSPLIEIGAGMGYWAKLIAEAGADIIAFDADPGGLADTNVYHITRTPLYFPVQIGGPEKIAENPGRTLFLCWPPYDDPFVTQCLDVYHGDTLIYVGEGHGGCTGWDERLDAWKVADYVYLPQWEGIHDYLMVFKRLAS